MKWSQKNAWNGNYLLGNIVTFFFLRGVKLEPRFGKVERGNETPQKGDVSVAEGGATIWRGIDLRVACNHPKNRS